MLNYREKEVIDCLVQTQDYLGLVDIAKMLNISTRTVSRYIKTINNELSKQGVEIKFFYGKGYKLIGEVGKELLLSNEHSYDIIVQDLLLHLVQSNDYITLQELSKRIHYSESVVNKRLPDVKKILKQYHLELNSQPSSGYFVKGNEEAVRNLLAKIAFQYHQNQIIEVTLAYFTMEDFKVLKELTVAYLTKEEIIISDIDMTNLLVRTSISVSRVRRQKVIPVLEKNKNDLSNNLLVVKSYYKCVAERFNIYFEEKECVYIAYSSSFAAYKIHKKEKIDSEIKSFVIEALKILSKESPVNYLENYTFVDALAIHINILVHRSYSGTEVHNEMLQQVKANYPYEMYDAVRLSKLIEKKFNIKINEAEIGYLAVHLGASRGNKKEKTTVIILCNYGMGTSELIKERLQQEFSNIEVLATYPVQYIELALAQEVDLLISSVPISHYSEQVPLVVVDDLLGDTFFEEVRKAIQGLHFKEKDLVNLFSEDLFFKLKATNKVKVMNQLLLQIEHKRQVPQNVLSSIRSREIASSTDIGNLVAIPHTLSKGSFESGIAVAVLDRPIIWGTERVQLILVLFFNQKDAKNAKIFREMYRYFKSIKKVNLLLKAENIDDFISRLDT